MRFPTIQSIGAGAAMTLAGLACSGCNYLGPAYLLVHGPEKAPAAYQPDKVRPTVVFVDDRANVLARRALRQRIAESAQQTLLKEGVLTNVIEASAALAAAAREPSSAPMEITALGKAVQAEIVIYVTVDSFGLSPDGQTFEPSSSFHVKVIDVNKPEAPRVWPPEKEGCPVSTTIKTRNAAAPTGLGERVAMLDTLADKSGVVIAQLFYDHETNDHVDEAK
jgi:hypothetical protein